MSLCYFSIFGECHVDPRITLNSAACEFGGVVSTKTPSGCTVPAVPAYTDHGFVNSIANMSLPYCLSVAWACTVEQLKTRLQY